MEKTTNLTGTIYDPHYSHFTSKYNKSERSTAILLNMIENAVGSLRVCYSDYVEYIENKNEIKDTEEKIALFKDMLKSFEDNKLFNDALTENRGQEIKDFVMKLENELVKLKEYEKNNTPTDMEYVGDKGFNIFQDILKKTEHKNTHKSSMPEERLNLINDISLMSDVLSSGPKPDIWFLYRQDIDKFYKKIKNMGCSDNEIEYVKNISLASDRKIYSFALFSKYSIYKLQKIFKKMGIDSNVNLITKVLWEYARHSKYMQKSDCTDAVFKIDELSKKASFLKIVK